MKTHKLQAWLLIALTLIWSGPVSAQSVIATPLPNAKQTFLDANGNPLSGGSVYTYVPSTAVKKTTWSDTGETTQNTNPVVLDAAGQASIWGQGSYRQVVKDSAGNTIWDAFTTAVSSATPAGGAGTDTAPIGTVMAFTGYTTPTNWLLAYGQAVSRTTYSDLEAAITITNGATSCTSGSATLSGLASTSSMYVGAKIEASCLPVGTTIASILSATSITVSQNATATGSFSSTVFPWGNGDGALTFNLPDLRGRVIAGADAMGGTAANRLSPTYYSNNSAATPGLAGGTQSKSLVTANLPPYTPSGTNSVPTVSGGSVAGNGGSTLAGTGGSIVPLGAANIVVGASTFTGTPQGGTSTAFSVVQPTLTFNYIIKVKNNTSGAGGVTSINGMFGDVVCDATFACTPVGSVNTIGLAAQANNTVLANVSGGSAQPLPTTVSALLDSSLGSARGSLLYRGAAGWSALAPGSSGFVLSTQGTGADPVWVANSNPSANQSANTFYGGPASGAAAPPTFRALGLNDLPSGLQTYYMSSWVGPSGEYFSNTDSSHDNTPAMNAFMAAVTAGTIPPGSVLQCAYNNGKGYRFYTPMNQWASSVQVQGLSENSPCFFVKEYQSGHVTAINLAVAATNAKSVGVSGTLTTGHTMSINFTSPSVTVSHTVASGDNHGIVAADLLSQINTNSTLSAAGVHAIAAWNNSNLFGIYWTGSDPGVGTTDPDSNLTVVNPIRLSAAQAITAGQTVGVYGVGGTTEANGTWAGVQPVDASHTVLIGSTFINAYTSGGTMLDAPLDPFIKLGPTGPTDFYAGNQVLNNITIQAGATVTNFGGIGIDLGSYDLTAGGPCPATWPCAGLGNGHWGTVYNDEFHHIFSGSANWWIPFRIDGSLSTGSTAANSFAGARDEKIHQSAIFSGLSGTALYVRGQEAVLFDGTQTIPSSNSFIGSTTGATQVWSGAYNRVGNGGFFSGPQSGLVAFNNYSVGVHVLVGNSDGPTPPQPDATGNKLDAAYASETPTRMNGVYNNAYGPYWETHASAFSNYNEGDYSFVMGGSTALTIGASNKHVTISSAAGNALQVASPTATVFQVDASSASQATGVVVTGQSAGNGASITAISTAANDGLTLNAKGSGNVVFNNTATGAVVSYRNLYVGPNGTLNASFAVDTSVTGASTGVGVGGQTTGNGALLFALSSVANEDLKIDAKGSGAIRLQGTGTGPVILRASAAGAASLNLPHGAAPTSPVNGDVWTTTAGLFTRINGATYNVTGPLSSPQPLTKTDDANVTLTLGGTPATALLQPVSLTLGWTGQLALSRGGTGANLSATGGASQVLKQTSVGGAVTVARLACADLSDSTASCSTDTTNASNIATGTLSAALLPSAPLNNHIASDVTLNNIANYFDGPSVAQGSTGTWLACGTITALDTSAAAAFTAKLWDGTTVVSSTGATSLSANVPQSLSLCGYITNPAGNIRISVRDATSTNGLMKFSYSGLGRDSNISVYRIN